MEKEPLVVRNEILINAPTVKVWEVLTNPEQTKKYMFGCETVSDWKKGSSLLWRAVYEGKETVFVEGTIVDIKPGTHLAYTTIDSQATERDTPENDIVVTYDLSEKNGQTLLKVTQGDYARVINSEKRWKEASNNGDGWNPILLEIKKVAES